MKPQVNIAVVVDVIGALSDKSLGNGNLCMVDDGPFESTGQGTVELCTTVAPGQTVQWYALAVDLQTPVEIKSIRFLGPDGEAHDGGDSIHGSDGDHLDLDAWTGVVPPFMQRGVPHKYQLELQMYEGDHSVLRVDSPALMCL